MTDQEFAEWLRDDWAPMFAESARWLRELANKNEVLRQWREILRETLRADAVQVCKTGYSAQTYPRNPAERDQWPKWIRDGAAAIARRRCRLEAAKKAVRPWSHTTPEDAIHKMAFLAVEAARKQAREANPDATEDELRAVGEAVVCEMFAV